MKKRRREDLLLVGRDERRNQITNSERKQKQTDTDIKHTTIAAIRRQTATDTPTATPSPPQPRTVSATPTPRYLNHTQPQASSLLQPTKPVTPKSQPKPTQTQTAKTRGKAATLSHTGHGTTGCGTGQNHTLISSFTHRNTCPGTDDGPSTTCRLDHNSTPKHFFPSIPSLRSFHSQGSTTYQSNRLT